LQARPVEQLLWWLAAVPAIAVIVLIFCLPLAQSLVYSFLREGQFSFANYALVFRFYWQDVVYTVIVATTGLALAFAVGIPLAGYLRLHHAPVVEFLLKVPLFVPFVVVGHAMAIFFDQRGWLLLPLYALGLISPDPGPGVDQGRLDFDLAMALAWKHLGLIMLLLVGAFRAVDESYLEAARGFGAGMFRQVWQVLVPMSAPSIILAAVLAFSSMLASFSIPLMMGEGAGPQMLMIHLYHRFGLHGDLGGASAIGVVSYLLAAGAAYYYLRAVLR
jgi:ABC-type sugar transport system permease subunit